MAVGARFTEMITCFYCHQNYDEDKVLKTKSGKFACESCFDPADPEQRLNENEAVINNGSLEDDQQISFKKYVPNTFINKNEKDNEKATEILNIDKLNASQEIPNNLNIIDCPPDINPDKD